MAYWAKIDLYALVTEVAVSDSEPKSGTWIQTYKDRSQRKNYASKGYTWDATRNFFIPPKPFDSWVFVESTCQWKAPVPYPDDSSDINVRHEWDEANRQWKKV